jgi:hypothetical protein
MALIRHIAGIPTATEQRCVRCCEVIAEEGNDLPCWPGQQYALDSNSPEVYAFPHEPGFHESVDCTPHDPHLVDELRQILGDALQDFAKENSL